MLHVVLVVGRCFFSDQLTLKAEFPVLPPDHVIWVKASRGAALEQDSRLVGAYEGGLNHADVAE